MQVQIEVKKVYGVDKIYPINDAAKIIASIAGTKTLSVANLIDAGRLGLEVVEIKTNYQPIADMILAKIKLDQGVPA